jgi:hypothetical protein
MTSILERIPKEVITSIVQFLDAGKYGNITLEIKHGRVMGVRTETYQRIESGRVADDGREHGAPGS